MVTWRGLKCRPQAIMIYNIYGKIERVLLCGQQAFINVLHQWLELRELKHGVQATVNVQHQW